MAQLEEGLWLTQKEAASVVGISQPAMSHHVRRNAIAHKRIGGLVLILLADAENFRDKARPVGRPKNPCLFREKLSQQYPGDKHESLVYFVRCGEFVKIGHSTNVLGRVTNLQTASPHKMELIAFAPGGPEEERRLHKMFAEYRTRPDSEWFTLSETIVEYIRSLNSELGL